MTEAEFASWAMKILLSGLIIFLGFIVWNLGKELLISFLVLPK